MDSVRPYLSVFPCSPPALRPRGGSALSIAIAALSHFFASRSAAFAACVLPAPRSATAFFRRGVSALRRLNVSAEGFLKIVTNCAALLFGGHSYCPLEPGPAYTVSHPRHYCMDTARGAFLRFGDDPARRRPLNRACYLQALSLGG
jgi:hypothetical protein